jgi:hypothetical protein
VSAGEFKLARKLGQENDHSIQVPIPPAAAIFLPSIFLPNHSRPMTQPHLNGVPPSMSALSPIVGDLQAFSMNGTDHRGRADDCSTFEDVIAASGRVEQSLSTVG